MGGKNPQVILEDADLDLAVEAALWGAFGTSGQRCTASSRMIVHAKIYDRFIKKFLAATKKLRLGPGLEPFTDLGPIINEKQIRQIHRYVVGAKKQGARLICGGGFDKKGPTRHGFFYKPTIFINVKPGMTIARQEVFGPVVVVIKVKNFEEAMQVVNDTAYGLSSSVFTKDISRAIKSVEVINAGITYINSSTIGAEAHPDIPRCRYQ